MSKAQASLERSLPEGSWPLLKKLWMTYPLQIKITRARLTKLGDYRAAHGHKLPRISINGDLNPYAFLITLLHEYAHHVAFEKHGRGIKAHGPEWQQTYRELCDPYFEAALFPEEVATPLRTHLRKGYATTHRSQELLRALKAFDEPGKAQPSVEELDEGSLFILGRKIFRKGPKARKNYQCENVMDRRLYHVHPQAPVTPVSDNFLEDE